MRKKVYLFRVIVTTLLSVSFFMSFVFYVSEDSCTWTRTSIYIPIIGALATAFLLLYFDEDDEAASASSKTESKTGMQGVWERSNPEWMHISDFEKRHGSDYIELSQKNPEFLNHFCPKCGEELYIRNWQVSSYDPRTGAPTTKVIRVTCPWHKNQSREINEPFTEAL